MKNSMCLMSRMTTLGYYIKVMSITLFVVIAHNLGIFAQCTPTSQTLDGRVFIDNNLNGIAENNESGKSGVLVQVFGTENQFLGSAITGSNGSFNISGLTDGHQVRLIFGDVPSYFPTKFGSSNGTNVQFLEVPACGVSYGISDQNALCNEDTEIMTTCFVQGSTESGNVAEPTIVVVKYGFNSSTNAKKFAMHGETGSIWGLAFRSSTKEIFSSAFVKQYSGLKAGHDAIFRSSHNGVMYTTSLFKNLRDLGQEVGTLAVTDITDCRYGSQVGKIGLGAIVMSPDEKYLFVVNIYNNTIVRIDINNPVAATTESYKIPGEGYYAFALKYYQGKIYTGITKPGVHGKVLIFDPVLKTFQDSGLDIPVGAAWVDNPDINSIPYHWLTDIDFTDSGDMIIALADRIGHMYCNTLTSRLDEQRGDLLIAYKRDSGWELEDRSKPGTEFFSDEYWVVDSTYHPETTLGGIFAMPGQGSVVSVVFDPETNSYSGGLHRYSTSTGKKVGTKELYNRNTEVLFGKASGFGDVVGTCGKPDIEIGNLLWLDENKNGIQDANEKGISGVEINLFNDNCELIASTTTDGRGNYIFNNLNVSAGLFAGKNYFVGIAEKLYDVETQSYSINHEHLKLTPIKNSDGKINSDHDTYAECNLGLVKTITDGTNHNFDIGLIQAGSCDLIISKKVLNTKAIKVGDDVEFMIEVHNRGEIALSEYTLLDRLPKGYVFSTSKNSGWSRSADSLLLKKIYRLLPGKKDTSYITLSLDQRENNIQYTNEVYLLTGKDGDGNVMDNLESCFTVPENRKGSGAPIICDLSLIHKVEEDRIYTPDTKVSYISTVCNQGTQDAAHYDVLNYVNDELDFDPNENPGWTLSQNAKFIIFSEKNILSPGTCKDYKITFTIGEDADPKDIINYAEISGMACTGVPDDFDFDSSPDTIKTNDIGGQPNTLTDNMASDHGVIDEDDHDPATLNVQNLDLSIKKHALLRRVTIGTIINYFLDITNEGQLAVSRAKLKDYLPVYLTLIDSTWTLNGQFAEKTVVFPGNLQPGQTYRATIKCQVNDKAIHPIIIRNRIEIADMFDIYNRDVSHLDKDSTPDNYKEKDPDDNAKDDEEDDTSLYDVSLICPPVIDFCSARCVVGTNPRNGMIGTFIKFAGIKGDEWRVHQADGLYDTLSTAGNPLPLPDPYYLDTIFHTVDYDEYIFEALQLDGKGFSVTFINKFGETESFSNTAGFCSLTKVSLTGPAGVCIGNGSSKYTANVVSTGIINPIYDWIIDANGISEPSDTLRNRGSMLDTLWTSSGTFTITVFIRGECVSPAEMTVVVGNIPTGSMVCNTSINLPLDSDCAVTVTPSMLAAGDLINNSAYTVMLMDAQGQPIPNATVTAEHAGTRVMGKLIEICSANSCWTWIDVEDKTPPVALCKNIEMSCFALNSYDGPFERDNCGGPVQNILISETTIPVCKDSIVKYIDRIYQATDKFGNKSDTCKLRITVLRPNLTAERGILTFPPNWMTFNAIQCDQLKLDKEGRPDPHFYGVPKYGPYDVFPTGDEFCNIVSWYEDKILKAGCLTKIIRSWHVYEQCGGEYQHRTEDQIIEISDKKAPRIEPIANVTISTSGHDCAGDYWVPLPQVSDTCNNSVTIDIIYPGGIIQDIKQSTKIRLGASSLPHVITVRAYDACLNTSQISYTVQVIDNTAPTVICKGETVASLNSNGQAYVYAQHINDGSYDECPIEKYLIRRMNPACQPCEAPILPGFTYVGEYINPGKNTPHYYYVSKHKANAQIATKTASALGGYLVHLNNANEKDWVHSKYQEWQFTDDYIIGLRDETAKGQFNWQSGLTTPYTNWETGYPGDIIFTPSNLINDSTYVRAKYSNSKWVNFNTDNGEFLYIVEIEDPCGFSESVKFCCTDVTRPQTVILRAIDKSGNWNECMTTVTIQDKFAPQITCPENKTTDCSQAYEGMDLSGFGKPVITDACNAQDSILPPIFKLNACKIGTIERRFIAYDAVNTATCTQIITVTADDDSRFNPEKHVDFPKPEYEVNDKCSAEDLEPDNLPEGYRRPVIHQTACSMASATYKDEVYTFATGACYKIIRTWTVIDWCEMERLGIRYTPYKFIQTIKVNNTVPPYFEGTVLERDTFETAIGNCSDALISLEVTGKDLCTPDNQLRKVVKIDLNNDGHYEQIISGVGNVNRITNRSFPVGIHRVQWSFEDACGNIVTKDQIIVVVSSDKPVAVALEKVSVSVVPWDIDGDGKPDIEKVCIDAASLNASSFSTCCGDKPLRFSFSSNPDSTKICFDCRHVGQDNIVEFWVHDCNGKTDVVNVKIDVQDNNDSDVCEKLCEENPVIAIITGVNTVCEGSTTTLTATGGVHYKWSNGATSSSIEVSPTITTVYTVTASGQFGCSGTASVTVTVQTPPTVAITGADICSGGSTTLTASGSGTYLWNTGATTAAITVSPTSNTTYTVTVTNENGCTASLSREVVISQPPVVNITGNNSVCINQSSTLTATGGGAYVWSTGETTSSIVVTPNVATTYSVTVTNQNGCSASDSIQVTVNGLTINPAIAGDNIFCIGESTVLTASGGNRYLWNTGATTTSINVAPVVNTSYSVTVTDVNGCTGIATSNVVVNPLPNVDIDGDTVSCPGSAVDLTASGAVSYLWSTGQTSTSITVNPTTATTYVVTGTDGNGCIDTAATTVTMADLSRVSITGNNIICPGDSTVIKATGGIAYLWNNGVTIDSIMVKPIATTTYTVTVTTSDGCTAILNRTVTLRTPPTASINGDTSICPGTSTTLTASGGGTYLWNTGATTASIVVNPTTNTTFAVTVTDIDGCTNTDSIEVNILPPPDAKIDGDFTICPGDSTSLTASGGTLYLWSNGATTNVIVVKPISPSTYIVTVTHANGCTDSLSVLVNISTPPRAGITGIDSICVGDSITLTASGGATYLWNTGATTETINVTPTTATTYTVTVTDANGCTATASKQVNLYTTPVGVISGDLVICLGDSTILSASGGTSYKWSNGATTSSIKVIPDTTTTYTVTVTDIHGCTASTSATVSVDPGTLVCTTKNITAYLGTNGSVIIKPEDISTGALGSCPNITARVTPNNFFCNDVGRTFTVTLIVKNTVTNDSLTCTADITVQDTLPPVIICPPNVTVNCETFNPNAPLSTYGTVTVSGNVSDNCPAGLTVSEEPAIRNLNNCNAGQIIRTFIATDRMGNTSQCVQIVNIVAPSPLTLADIAFPPSKSITSCQSIDTSNTGRARITRALGGCSKVTISYSDNPRPQVPLCAQTIIRSWVVVDSCQLLSGTNNGIYTFNQTITVTNQPPVINGPTVINIQGGNVDCSGDLDGLFHTASGCNLTMSNSQNDLPSFNISGTYPLGSTDVILTASDICGNIVSKNVTIEVTDTSSLRIRCIKFFPQMTDQLFVDAPVSSYYEVTKKCSDDRNILATFTSFDINDNVKRWNCNDRNFTYTFSIYFFFEGATTPFFTCDNAISRTQDPNNFCGNLRPVVSGSIKTENQQAVKDVTISMEGSNTAPIKSDIDGAYAFPDMPTGGTYDIVPSRNNNFLEGVSTLDLISIQRHILGIEAIASPYQLIAADINGDHKITAADLTLLRKVILGVQDHFGDNKSWMLIDKNHKFIDPLLPFGALIPVKYHIPSLDNNMTIDWVGVKIGDVNGSYVSNIKDVTSGRTSDYNFIINRAAINGPIKTIPVTSGFDNKISGFQISLHIGAADMVKVTSDILDILDYHYAYHDGILNISWHNAQGIDVLKDDILFNIELKTHGSGDNTISMADMIKPELYSVNKESFVLGLKDSKTNFDKFELIGNTPNPWNHNTEIKFVIPANGEVSIRVRDITGRIIYTAKDYMYKGENSIIIQAEQLNGSGVLLYDITFDNEIKTMKMLNIR